VKEQQRIVQKQRIELDALRARVREFQNWEAELDELRDRMLRAE
jgi:hypothetical protein